MKLYLFSSVNTSYFNNEKNYIVYSYYAMLRNILYFKFLKFFLDF